MPTVGFLHPGRMGAAMATVAKATTLWAGSGRSPESHQRAETAQVRDVSTIETLANEADILISICPPDAAMAVAHQVAQTSFAGIYVDANAVSPGTARRIADQFDRYVDGSVVGPPPGPTWPSRLYLSGAHADAVAAVFAGTALEPRVLGDEAGAASALKMGYAGFTKGIRGLVLDVAAFAEAEGVSEPLWQEFSESQPTFEPLATGAATGAVPKAWRFGGEMREIAAAYRDAELPDGFWIGAAEVYAALAGFKNADPPPDIAEVVAKLRGG